MDINTIARMAGVSRATVSRYLNNGYVSAEKRTQIAKVIEETGYVPSRQARTLRTGKTNLVGVIIPKLGSESVQRMVRGISEVLQPAGYQIILASADNQEDSEPGLMRVLTKSTGVDGLVLIGTIFTEEHTRAFDEVGVPVVVLGQHVSGRSCVFHDDRGAMFEVASCALRSSKHPAYIGVTLSDQAAGTQRRRGFREACEKTGIDPATVPIETCDFTLDAGYMAAERLLEKYPETDALICASDSIALGALTCLHEYGKRCPEDVQVTGIGDSEMACVVTPTLTTVRHHYRACGTEAARMLLDAMSGVDAVPREMRVGHDLLVRSSTL